MQWNTVLTTATTVCLTASKPRVSHYNQTLQSHLLPLVKPASSGLTIDYADSHAVDYTVVQPLLYISPLDLIIQGMRRDTTPSLVYWVKMSGHSRR